MARLTLDLQFGEDIIIVNKPAGISTHAPDPGKLGMAELVQMELALRGIDKKVFVCHRLDKTTTGALLFATTEKTAADIYELFQKRQVFKKYHFLTATSSEKTEGEIYSQIEKVDKQMQSKICAKEKANAQTRFQKIKSNARFQLWQAEPKSGKSHQIRLHARDFGIPILGDELYGGLPYPHLCLHAAELAIPGFGHWKIPHPPFFERMGLLRDSKLAEILSGFDSRERLYHFLAQHKQCLRLLHHESTRYRIDQFGEVLWVYWYDEADPSPEDLERFEFLETFLRKKVFIRKMQNRGNDPQSQKSWSFSAPPETWQADENGLHYEFRQSQGLSPGLFLDQRENRHWVLEKSKAKKVLNLFAYTGGFSVAAAKGGAKEVVTVDLSKTFLEWSKKNFSLNELDPQASGYQFFLMDTFQFLSGTIKKKRQFDLIICDPPSFSRNGKEVFRIEKDLPELIDLCWQCLEPNGTLLFSCNYEKWTESSLLTILKKILGSKAQFESMSFPNLDFEMPNEEKLMKSFRIKKLK